MVLFVRIAPTPHHGAGRTRHDHGGAGPPIAPLLSSPLLSSPLISTTPHRRPTPPTQGFAEEGCWPAAFGGLRAAASLPVGQAATERARALVDSLCRESTAPGVPPRCGFSRRSSSLAAKNTTGLEGVRVSSSHRRRHGARAHAREAPSHGRHGAVPCVYVAAGTAGPLGRAREQPPPINLCSTQPCRTMRIQCRRILGTVILDLELDSCARSTCHAFFRRSVGV